MKFNTQNLARKTKLWIWTPTILGVSWGCVPRGRMLLFRSAPEITKVVDGCHLVWDRKSSSERPAGDYDDKIVIIAALLAVSLLPLARGPHLGVKLRRSGVEWREHFFAGNHH